MSDVISDDVLIDAIAAGGKRLRKLLAWSVATRARAAIGGTEENYEAIIGDLEHAALDTLCALRGLRSARAGGWDSHAAAKEFGESCVKLAEQVAKLRTDALAGIS